MLYLDFMGRMRNFYSSLHFAFVRFHSDLFFTCLFREIYAGYIVAEAVEKMDGALRIRTVDMTLRWIFDTSTPSYRQTKNNEIYARITINWHFYCIRK